MAGLPWLPRSVLDTTESWGWTNTVSSALGSIKDAGESIMKPIGQHVADAMPTPPPIAMPEVTLPEVTPFALPDLSAWGFGQPAAPTAPQPQQDQGFTLSPGPTPDARVTRRPPAATSGGFSLPDITAWGMAPTARPPSEAAQPPTPASAGAAPGQPTGPAPERGGDLRAYARAVAARNGIDPETFVAQIQQESGFNPTARSGAGAQGIAQFMPATAASYGVDVNDPYSSLDGAARHMADNLKRNAGDYRLALAAYNAGQGNVDRYGEGVFGADFAHGQTRDYIARILGGKTPPPFGAAPAQAQPTAGEPGGPELARGSVWAPGSSAEPKFGTYTAENLSPNQFTEGQAQGLSAEEALAVCGPAAAVAFARANGRNPTLREAKELAQNLGLWDASQGMHGPGSQVQLLQKMGIEARMEPGTDWTKVAAQVQAGKPVIVDTPSHYFTVSGYDPQTGQFEFGQSAGVLRASKGRTRFRPDEIAGLGMGAPRATIFLGGR